MKPTNSRVASADRSGVSLRIHSTLKLLAGERADDVAVDQRAAVVRDAQLAVSRELTGEVAEKATGEGVACARGIAHVFERIGRRGEEAAVGAEEQRAVRRLA